MSRLAANLLLLIAGAVWGMGFVAQSTAMDRLGPWTFTAVRFALAALTLLPFAWVETRRAQRLPTLPRIALFVAAGTLLFGASITQQIGIVTTTVTNSGFLTGLYVVMTPFLALVLLRQKPHPVVWPAAFSALAGIFLLGGASLAALNGGDLWTIACAVFWSLQILTIGLAGRAEHHASAGGPFTLAFVQFAVCALVSAVGALTLETTPPAALVSAWRELAYGGIFAAGLAFTLQIIGQRHTSAPQAAIFLSSEALFAGLFGALLLDERLPALGLVGCALIFAAILAVELVPMLTMAKPRKS